MMDGRRTFSFSKLSLRVRLARIGGAGDGVCCGSAMANMVREVEGGYEGPQRARGDAAPLLSATE